MTLLEKLNKELSNYGLEFKSNKECNDKFKGVLVQKQTNAIIPFEVHKSLQFNAIKSHCEWVVNYVDMYLKIKEVK